MIRKNLARILLSAAALIILVVLFYRLGPENILSLFRQIGWKFLGVVIIFSAQEMVRAMALVQCLPGETCPAFRELVYVRLIGEAVRALTLTGPLLAEPSRAWLIRRQGVPSSQA